MLGKKAFLAKVMSRTQISQVLVALRALLKNEIVILAYHRVLDAWQEHDFEFDVELISASVDEFKWQVDYVRNRFSPISFRDLIAYLDGNAGLPKRPILITFDDGFDDNYYHAFPVLKSAGVPATVFLSTGYIGGPQTFWYDWLCYLCHHVAATRTSFWFADREFALGADTDVRRDNIAKVFVHAKRLPDETLRLALRELETELGISYPVEGFVESHPLNWDQVREMSKHGIEFGSHSVSHPVLTNLTGTRLQEELVDSKCKLEREVTQPVEVIAYPVGEAFAFNDAVIRSAVAAGYKLGVTYIPGPNNLSNLGRFNLKRLHVERYMSRADFQAMLAMPELFA